MGHIGAQVRRADKAQRKDACIRVERKLPVILTSRGAGHRRESFHPFSHPFHRPKERLGSKEHERKLHGDRVLQSEAAADIGCDHPQFLGQEFSTPARRGDRECRSSPGSGCIACSGRGSPMGSDAPAWLHGIGHHPILDQLYRDGARRGGEAAAQADSSPSAQSSTRLPGASSQTGGAVSSVLAERKGS